MNNNQIVMCVLTGLGIISCFASILINKKIKEFKALIDQEEVYNTLTIFVEWIWTMGLFVLVMTAFVCFVAVLIYLITCIW